MNVYHGVLYAQHLNNIKDKFFFFGGSIRNIKMVRVKVDAIPVYK